MIGACDVKDPLERGIPLAGVVTDVMVPVERGISLAGVVIDVMVPVEREIPFAALEGEVTCGALWAILTRDC